MGEGAVRSPPLFFHLPAPSSPCLSFPRCGEVWSSVPLLPGLQSNLLHFAQQNAGGLAQLVRALASHARSRQFESAISHFFRSAPEKEITDVKISPPLARTFHTLRSEMLSLKNPIRDGFITVPDGPGLGVELDEEAIARHLPAVKPMWI